MKYCLALLSLVFVSLVLVGQPTDRMEPVSPESFAGPSPTEVTEETVVTFRYGPKRGNTTGRTYIGDPANNNFTWYCKTERKVRIHLNDSILKAGIAIQLNPLAAEELLALSGVLYSLVGNKVNRENLGRKIFARMPIDGIIYYLSMLTSPFKRDIFELNYIIERPYVSEHIVWYANEAYGMGMARMEFLYPDYIDYDFRYMNLGAGDYTLKEENHGGYMTIVTYADAGGKNQAWKKVNITYRTEKKIFVTRQPPAPNVQRGFVATVTAIKPVIVR